MKNKKAQQTMGMPFGMIFSIFLIVVFIVIAFIAVKSFLGTSEIASIGLFYEDLQSEVSETIQQQMSESEFKIDLPKKIKKVCFANLSTKITNDGPEYQAIKNYDVYKANIFLIPPEQAPNMDWDFIDHINTTKITETKNPYCVPVSNKLKISKGFYDKLVTIQ